MDKKKRMKELISILSDASMTYYQESREIMSNLDYDRLYDELLELEKETGVVLSNSLSQKVGYEILSELPKENHEKPMLSLDKTKSVDDLVSWLGNQKALLSWKLDGLTIVLTYKGGELVKAVTRGSGYTGEVITNNAKVFDNIPLKIAYKGELILRGEAVISYADFNKINQTISEVDARYKNPRNLCAGSVRQLNNQITKQRHVNFKAFMLVKAQGVAFNNSRQQQFEWLTNQGFDVVEYEMTDALKLPQAVLRFADNISTYDIPSDGLVLLFDDIAYGESLGMTAKFPRNSIAFKWSDEIRETKLRHIEWSPSRTGLINPIAVFEPVELEGTTVSRASVHNLSILEALELGDGDTITVYKANMIIPQVADNITRSGVTNIPELCPVCSGKTEIRQDGDVKTLYCVNPDCQVKHIKSFALMASRDALNIDGLSEQTLEKLISAGFIKEYSDMFHLDRYKDKIVTMEGFGLKSYDNIIAAIDKAKTTTVARFIYALGIPGIGVANAKMLSYHFNFSFDELRHAKREELTAVDGIGDVLADSIAEYFANDKKNRIVDDLLLEITWQKETSSVLSEKLAGMTFVITGSVEHFKNRKEMEDIIESRGGKTTSAVTSKTTYLINNDTTSNSSKNKKAKQLGIPIIPEEEFIKLIEEEA